MTDGFMGELPDWFEIVYAALQIQQHPADMANIPRSKPCKVWIYWIISAKSALDWVRDKKGMRKL